MSTATNNTPAARLCRCIVCLTASALLELSASVISLASPGCWGVLSGARLGPANRPTGAASLLVHRGRGRSIEDFRRPAGYRAVRGRNPGSGSASLGVMARGSPRSACRSRRVRHLARSPNIRYTFAYFGMSYRMPSDAGVSRHPSSNIRSMCDGSAVHAASGPRNHGNEAVGCWRVSDGSRYDLPAGNGQADQRRVR
jgi:hypothetical protein